MGDYTSLKDLERMGIIDSGLRLDASFAAVAIDCYNLRQKGKNVKLNSIDHLAELFNDITQGGTPWIYRDPIAVTILSNVIFNTDNLKEHFNERCHVDNLVLQTNLLAKDLRDFREKSKEQREELRDFCVELSKTISASCISLCSEYGFE